MTATCLSGSAAARALHAAGVQFVAGVAGESFLPLLEGLRTEGISFIPVVHESGATFLSSAHARITGRPAVAVVTRGPGASNALIGIHEAAQAAAPVVLIVGQLETRVRGRKALQEMEMTQVFGSVAKAAFEVSRADQVAPSILAALRKATVGRPGPVVVSVPADLFFEKVQCEEAQYHDQRPSDAALNDAALADLVPRINNAERGIFIAGAAFAGGQHSALLGRVAQRTGFGVIGGHAFPDVLPTDHPHWLGCSTIRGSRALKRTLADSDLIVLLDHWLGDRVTQGYLPLKAQMVAIAPTPDVGWDEYLGAHLLTGTAPRVLAQLDAVLGAVVDGATRRAAWVAERRDALATEADRTLRATADATPPGQIPFAAIIDAIDRSLPADVTLVSDAGSFNDWIIRYLPFREGRRYLGTLSGSMGSAVPGALGVQLARPTGRAVALVGDGGFLMTGMEAATIARLGLPVTVVVFRNDIWGSIALHQDRHFPGQRFGTGLPALSYAQMAQAMSLAGFAAATPDELGAALTGALAFDGPALVEVRTDALRPSPSSYEEGASL